MQLDFFNASAPVPVASVDNDSNRPYQNRIVDEAVSLLGLGKSPLIEMATGTGKTRVGSSIVKRTPQWRWLWLAERREWLEQAQQSLQRICNEPVGWESPNRYSTSERIVLASKDTIRGKQRLERLSNYRPFNAVITDEAHHAEANTYRAVYAAYPGALRVGLSATPDRHDRRRVTAFDAATTPYRIVEAIEDAWLVPILAKRVKVKSVDLDLIGLRSGDFAAGELDNLFAAEEPIHGCVDGLLREAGQRPTIVFCPGLSSAHRTAEVIERRLPGRARVVSGTTPDLERSEIFREFGRSYQFLVNVQVATEGTDLPTASCIALFRPTRSRSLFQQMIGRGLRPLAGLSASSTARDRTEAIASSQKRDCLVLDFVGNATVHSIVTAADVLTDSATVAKRVADRISAGDEPGNEPDDEPVSVLDAIREEAAKERDEAAAKQKRKQREREKRAAITGNVSLHVTDIQLIGLGGIPDGVDLSALPVSPSQASEMTRLGISLVADVGQITAQSARKAILERRSELGLATEKQMALLTKHRPLWVSAGTTKTEARKLTWKLMRQWNR